MANIYDMIDTWNNGATTFTAIKMDVLDSASAANSLLLDLKVDGVTKASINKDGGLTVTTTDINGGTIDDTVIGGTTPAAVTTTALVATTADINGGTIDDTVIGGSTAAAGSFTTLELDGTALTATATELNYTDGVTSNIQTQLNTKAPIASPTFTGTTTIPTADINGGAIDDTVIGGTTAAAGTFTTGQFDTSVNVDGTVTADGLSVGIGGSNTDIAYVRINGGGGGGGIQGQMGIGFSPLGPGATNIHASIEAVELTSASFRTDLVLKTNASNTDSAPLERLRIANNGDISFYEDTGTTAKFFWDASAESLGIGTSSPAFALVVEDTNTPAMLNILGTDGNILNFRKDGTTVGSIGTNFGTLLIGTGDTCFRFRDNEDRIMPSDGSGNKRDNIIDLGRVDARFDDIYATNGTIQTSDRKEKQDIEELSEAEHRVAVACKGLLRKFRWKSKVEEKGDDARVHFGIIAQDLQAAFEAEGLDAGRYAMFINSTWTDEETGEERSRMGIRYSELLAFIIAAI